MKTEEITQDQSERLAEYLGDIQDGEKQFQECKVSLIRAITENNFDKAPELFLQFTMYAVTIGLLKHIQTGEEPNY